jgi:hypothetical protein
MLNSTNLELCVTYIIIAYIVFLFCHVLYETNSIVSFHIEAKEALETDIVEQWGKNAYVALYFYFQRLNHNSSPSLIFFVEIRTKIKIAF